MSKRILITGGTGLVGQALTELLLENGHEVRYLSRAAGSTKSGIKKYAWNLQKETIEEEAIEWADVINVLRIQSERMGIGIIPSTREYRNFFGITIF